MKRPDFHNTDEAIRRSMRSNRGRDTTPELAIRRVVHAKGLRVSVRPVPSIRRTGDLVFPAIKLAVFVDGCFWHSCPDHVSVPETNNEWWSEKLVRTVERDRETDSILESEGWVVLRIWEHEDAHQAAARVEREARRLQTARVGTS